jgi:myo-inositol-1(or 4)-monophosphatase
MVCQLLSKVSKSVAHSSRVTAREKGTADFVTNIDLKVEKVLIDGLKEIDNAPCLSEESNHVVDCDNYWVIDPIDGTTNFIHGYPSYCVSIARVIDNVTEYGFVYNLVSKELFVGMKGKGSSLLNTRTGSKRDIRVSGCCELSGSIIGFGCPYDKSKVKKLFSISNKILNVCHDLKRNGPASLDICYVACGRLEGYYEFDLKEWDYKAAKLILEESGGKVTDWNGKDVVRGISNIVATNGRLHEEILKYLV